MSMIATINTTIRTLLALAVVGGLGMVGWFGYSAYRESDLEAERREAELAEARETLESQAALLEQNKLEIAQRDERIGEQGRQIAAQTEQIGALEDEVEQQKVEIDRLDTAVRLLKVDYRLARISVVDQWTDPLTEGLVSKIEFVEIDERGNAIDDPRTFEIRGDVVYVDHWVVKFDDEYVEQADQLRSASLVLFRRIFGEFQEPMQGFALDETGERPRAYAGGTVPSDFEEQIWGDFWAIANDPARAAELGIRAAHGEAVSMKLQEGRTYRLMLRASDGISIVPEE